MGLLKLSELNSKHKTLLFLLALVILNFIVYFPSISHIPRSDHNIYFAETVHTNSFSELVKNTYSYARTRQLAQGDAKAFKPLFFVILALEKYFFGYNYPLWQIVSIILHIFVVIQLYKILRLINNHYFSFLLTLNFSVLYVSQEMVIWQHMAPVLLFLILLFGSIYCFINSFYNEDKKGEWITKACLYLFPSVFIHEFGLIVIFIYIAFILLYNKQTGTFIKTKWAAILSVPLFCYSIFSFLDYISMSVISQSTNSLKLSQLTQIPFYLFKVLSISLMSPFLPMFIRINPGERLEAESFTPIEILRNIDIHNIFHLLNILLIILIFAALIIYVQYLLKNKSKPKNKNNLIVSLMCLTLGIFYILMVTVIRYIPNGQQYILNTLYYFYIIVALNLMCLYPILSNHLTKKLQPSRQLIHLITFILLLSAFLNGYKTYQLNAKTNEYFSQSKNEQILIGKKLYFLSMRHNELGYNLLKQGEFTNSLVHLNKAIDLNSKNEK